MLTQVLRATLLVSIGRPSQPWRADLRHHCSTLRLPPAPKSTTDHDMRSQDSGRQLFRDGLDVLRPIG